MKSSTQTTYAVLGAAYALRRFSLESLARTSGTPLEQVSEVISREEDAFEKTDEGFSLRTDAMRQLEERLERLYERAQRKRPHMPSGSTAIQGAEDILLYRIQETISPDTRERLLAEARRLLDAHAEQTGFSKRENESPRESVGPLVEALELVYGLGKAEAGTEGQSELSLSRYLSLVSQIAPVVARLLQSKDSARAALVGLRFLQSPVVSATLSRQRDPGIFGTLTSRIGRLLMRQNAAPAAAPTPEQPRIVARVTDDMEAMAVQQLTQIKDP